MARTLLARKSDEGRRQLRLGRTRPAPAPAPARPDQPDLARHPRVVRPADALL